MKKSTKKTTTNSFDEERRISLLAFLVSLVSKIKLGKIRIITWGTWDGAVGHKEFKVTWTEKE